VQPVVAPSYHVGVIKGAQHPNAAHLFAVFMTLPESQQVWKRTVAVSSALIPGTAYYQKSQGRQMIYMRKDQSDKVEALARKYGKMIALL
jgi:ABC-type Fe3+ transport system substrate-binding protein